MRILLYYALGAFLLFSASATASAQSTGDGAPTAASRASAEERAVHYSEVPALVITGEYDPMNPPVTGQEHLPSLLDWVERSGIGDRP